VGHAVCHEQIKIHKLLTRPPSQCRCILRSVFQVLCFTLRGVYSSPPWATPHSDFVLEIAVVKPLSRTIEAGKHAVHYRVTIYAAHVSFGKIRNRLSVHQHLPDVGLGQRTLKPFRALFQNNMYHLLSTTNLFRPVYLLRSHFPGHWVPHRFPQSTAYAPRTSTEPPFPFRS